MKRSQTTKSKVSELKKLKTLTEAKDETSSVEQPVRLRTFSILQKRKEEMIDVEPIEKKTKFQEENEDKYLYEKEEEEYDDDEKNSPFEVDEVIKQKLEGIVKRIKFKKYMKKLLCLSGSRLKRLLSYTQGRIINDQVYFFHNVNSNESKSSLRCFSDTSKISILFFKLLSYFTKLKRHISKFPVFLPHNLFLEIWQGIKIISILMCYFCYLVCFAFGYSLENTFNYAGLFSCQVVLMLDIVVTLNTGIYLKGVLCLNRRELLDSYKQSRALYYDIGSCLFVMIYYMTYSGQNVSRWTLALLLPIIFKHTDINFMIKKIKDSFILDKKMQNVVELVNLIKNILLISHVFACIWIYVAKISSTLSFQDYLQEEKVIGGHTWITLTNLQTETWSVQYLYSYYFITVTMLTVGYGDIRPVNPVETIVCTFLMLICCLIFGFTINQVGEIFQDFFSEEKNIRQKRCVIGNYMNRKDINSITKKNIYEYLEYYWKEQIDESLDEEKKIVSQLSDSLKEELFLESNKIILKQSQVLQQNFSPDLIKKCLPIIQEQNCTPGEVLVDSSIGNSECAIFFVQQGELEVSHRSTYTFSPGMKEGNVIRKIPKVIDSHSSMGIFIYLFLKGSSFGEREFFTGETQSMSVRSSGFSKILKIKRAEFIRIIHPIASEYESFCMLKDRAQLSNDVYQLYVKCVGCGEYSHDEIYCPMIHFKPRKDKIIGKGLIGQRHENRVSQFVRKRKEKYRLFENVGDNFQKFLVLITVCLKDLENYQKQNMQFSSFNKGIELQDGYESSEEEDEESTKEGKSDDQQDDEDEHVKKKDHEEDINLDSTDLSLIKRITQRQSTSNTQKQQQNGGQITGSTEQPLPTLNKPMKSFKNLKSQQTKFFNQVKLGGEEEEGGKEINELLKQSTKKPILKLKSTYSDQIQGRPAISKFLNKMKKQKQKENIIMTSQQAEQIFIGSLMKQRDKLPSNLPTILTEQTKNLISNMAYNNEILLFDVFKGEFDSLRNFKNYFPKYNFKEVMKSRGMLSYNKNQKFKNMKDNTFTFKRQRINQRKHGYKDNMTIRTKKQSMGNSTNNSKKFLMKNSKSNEGEDDSMWKSYTKNEINMSSSAEKSKLNNSELNFSLEKSMQMNLSVTCSPYPKSQYYEITKLKGDCILELNSSIRKLDNSDISIDRIEIASPDQNEELISERKIPSLNIFKNNATHFKKDIEVSFNGLSSFQNQKNGIHTPHGGEIKI